MRQRALLLATVGLAMAMACSDDSSGGTAGAGGTPTAGAMPIGMAGTPAAAGSGSGLAGATAAGAGAAGMASAAGMGAAGSTAGASAGMGAAGMAVAGMGASGMVAAGMGAGAGMGAAGASGTAAAGAGGAAGGGMLTLTSSVVMDGMMLPAKHRCMGGLGSDTGPSPPLAWTGAPAGTMSFAILMRDRTFMDYEHWTIYDIPATVTSLPEGVPAGAMPAMPAGAKQASNAAILPGPGYYGPCGGMNMYEFVLYALDVATLPMAGMTGDSVEAALEMHDLAKASLTVMSNAP